MPGARKEEMERLAEDVFRELAEHDDKEALDRPHILQVLEEEGFRGSASVVIIPEGDPEPVARKSVAYPRRLFGEPGSKEG